MKSPKERPPLELLDELIQKREEELRKISRCKKCLDKGYIPKVFSNFIWESEYCTCAAGVAYKTTMEKALYDLTDHINGTTRTS